MCQDAPCEARCDFEGRYETRDVIRWARNLACRRQCSGSVSVRPVSKFQSVWPTGSDRCGGAANVQPISESASSRQFDSSELLRARSPRAAVSSGQRAVSVKLQSGSEANQLDSTNSVRTTASVNGPSSSLHEPLEFCQRKSSGIPSESPRRLTAGSLPVARSANGAPRLFRKSGNVVLVKPGGTASVINNSAADRFGRQLITQKKKSVRLETALRE